MRHVRLLWGSVTVLLLSEGMRVYLPTSGTLRAFMLVVALLAFFSWVLLNIREILSILSRRSTKQWINIAVIVLLVLGIVVLIEVISFAYNVRLDLTPERRFSLSHQTKKLLKSVSGPLTATGFFRGGSKQRELMLDTFRLYQQEKPDFQFEILDLDRHPGRANQAGVSSYGETILKYEDRKTSIPYPSEEFLTSGILKILSDKKHVLLFLSAHGEKDIQSQPDDKNGYSLIRTALERGNYEVRQTPMLAKGVPEETSALIVAGPKTDLLDQELESIGSYLERGGAVFFLLDPTPLPKIKEFLKRYHIILEDQIVIDRENSLFGGEALSILVPYYKLHPITERFNIGAHFSSARPVGVEKKVEEATELARSSDQSWATPDLRGAYGGSAVFRQQQDRAGPVPVAAVAAVGSKGRLAVFGDSDFASNFMVDIPGGNRDLFLNTVEWLAGRRELISVRPKKQPTLISPLTFTKADSARMIGVLVLEGVVVGVVGIVVAVRRRKKF